MLKAHGWNVKPNGVSTCASPVPGRASAGPGLAPGQKLEFNLNYDVGRPCTSVRRCRGSSPTSPPPGSTSTWHRRRSTPSSPKPAPCKSCSWQMIQLGRRLALRREPLPDRRPDFRDGLGLELLATTAAQRPTSLINQTVHGTATLAAYENYLASQIPVLWMPHAGLSDLRGQQQAARGYSRGSPILGPEP